MRKLKSNEVICHECETPIDIDRYWEYTLINGKYYHFDCFKSDDIYEQVLVDVERHIKPIVRVVDLVSNIIDYINDNSIDTTKSKEDKE